MEYTEFKKYIEKFAKEVDIEAYELYLQESSSTSIKAYNGEVDKFSDNTGIGVCFRCLVDGKMGYAHTQIMSEEEARRIVNAAFESSKMLDEVEGIEIFKGSENYSEIYTSKEEVADVEKMKKIVIEMENKAKEKDSRVSSVPHAAVSFSSLKTSITNSYGLDLSERQNYYSAACQVVSSDGDEKELGFDYDIKRSIDEIDIDKIVDTAVSEAIRSLGGKPIDGKDYEVVFENKMAATMLGAFEDVFYADLAIKGLSLLKGKEGQKIAGKSITITDDPFCESSMFQSSFDDEGVATYKKNIVENGILKTLLYNLESATQSGKETTGNGAKGSYGGAVGVSSTNLYIHGGDITKNELISKVKKGVYITSLKGLHASADSTTGDFSLEAKGFFIENGEITSGTKPFTVAGNFYKMLNNIDELADDLYMDDTIGAPTMLVSGLSVAG